MPIADTILIITGMLAIAVIAAGLARRLPVPYTVVLVVLGMALGALARNVDALAPLLAFRLTPELVLYVFLPVLIFESAFNLNARQLIKDLAPILVLAVPALLASTAIIGVGLWGIIGIGLLPALLFGALISATDPVAVVALFRELGVSQRLTVLVEGESLLNDATAIVLFKILLAIALGGVLTWSQATQGLIDFPLVFFGGALVGVVIGAGASEIVHRVHADLTALLVMTFVMAYAAFALAEVLHASGVVAVTCAALSFAAISVARASQAALAEIRHVWEVAAMICNSLLFLLMGLTVHLSSLFENAGIIAAAIVLMLLGRAIPLYTLLPMTIRRFGLPQVSRGEQHVMWWGGLRGGLAIAIALSIPVALPERALIQELALGVVLFTMLVNALSIRPLIRRLGLDRMTDEERAELRDGLAAGQHAAEEALERFRRFDLMSRRVQRRVRSELREALASDGPEVAQPQALLHAHRRAVHAELETLATLHEQGVIEPYVFLDMRNALMRDRESPVLSSGASLVAASPFARLELAVIRRLREKDWAAGLLARYQDLRLGQRLQRDIAGVLTAHAALEALRGDGDLPKSDRERLAAVTSDRLARRSARIEAIRREFPEYFRAYERRLWERVALLSALARTESAQQHGALGAKSYARIVDRIQAVLAHLPSIARRQPAPQPQELVSAVPLFAGLREATLARLAQRAETVTFLANDTVIAEGEKGDSLYIVLHGRLRAERRNAQGEAVLLGRLGEDDFFGETALLGEHLRQATVTAETPCTLLRLTRDDVLALGKSEPEVLRRLEASHAERVALAARAGTVTDA
jgi:CPA1 family monovalent cation:H+ antiporter